MRKFPTKLLALASACALGLVACKGDTGPAGATGATGANGISTGTITGTLTYDPGTGEIPAPNISVNVTPAVVGLPSATSAADGTYELANVPIGVYTVTFSATGFVADQITGVSVVAGQTSTASKKLVAANPIVLAAVAATAPAGFGQTATLAVTVSGGTGPYTYVWTPKAANPTAVTLDTTNPANPTFTTGTFAQVLASGKVIGLGSPGNPDPLMTYPRTGFVSISTQQLAQMTYNFDCKVTDAVGFSKTVTVARPPATLAQGNGIVPRNQIVVLSLPGNATAVDFTAKPSGSAAVVNEAATPNPWFIPDVAGSYTVGSLTVSAGDFQSSSPTCGICHGTAAKAAVAAKFTAWSNSAHGNHFFKYMEYDAGGNLVFKAGVTQLPTANPGVFWKTSDMPAGPMTTFEFGMTGAEGTHYSQTCVGCHTTGYNALAVNGGFDDAAATAGWTFPNLGSVFTGLTGASTGDPVTPAPQLTAYNAIPAAVVKYQGMQCESCHGPLGQHVATGDATLAPKPELDVAICAVCHDRPSNHDRVALWRQSKHANLEVAVAEGAGTSGSPSNSCNRCHSGQGFVQYVDQILGNLATPGGTAIPAFPGILIDPAGTPTPPATVAAAGSAFLIGLGITPQSVQPQTCQACHDPHSTELRVSGNTPMLPAGFQVNGAGAGALCFVCHNSRNGARGDLWNGVYYNNPLPGTTTAVTSIGAPHESSQGDVITGMNAFWVGMSPSNHLAVEDVCVGCHMKYAAAGVSFRSTNHTWKVDTTICANCHGSNVNGEALQGQFDLAAVALNAAITSVGNTTFAGAYYMKGTVTGAQIATVPAGATTAVAYVSGRLVGFRVTLNVDVPDPNAATGTITAGTPITVGLGGFYSNAAATTRIFDLLNGRVAKANWNYSLVTQDGSRSIHNPTFAFGVLSASQAKVLDSSLAL